MTDSSFLAQPTYSVELGIRGLPELSGNMIGGGLYALKAETPSARFPLLAGSLANAFGLGLSCTVIVPSNPELFIGRIEAFGNINATELIECERLQVFITQSEFSKTIFRRGANSFVLELEQFEVPENSYLIFDQADELLSLHDISLALDQIDTLRKWFQQRGVTGLLVFSRATEEHAGTINALMDNLTGIARLGGGRDGLEITFDFWQSPEGTLAAQSYRLEALASGFYEVPAPDPGSLRQMAPLEPGFGPPRIESSEIALKKEVDDAEPLFFYLDPELGSLAHQIPGIWRQVDSMVSMLHATHNTRSSMSILSYQRDTSLRQLAETVHTLRQSLGRRARIVVCEKGHSLRYQKEALLLRLGVNLVIHRDVPIGRLPLLLESLKGQVFTRDVDIDFDAAVASVLSSRLYGYLPVVRFERELQMTLDRTEVLNIPCVLVMGKPVQGTTALNILQSINLTHAGDLISSDGESCYLFLNACPPSVMRATLDKILGMSAEAIFEDIKFWVRRDDIQAELANLLGRAERGELPDYSSMLVNISANEAPPQVGEAAATLAVEPLPSAYQGLQQNDVSMHIVPEWSTPAPASTPALAANVAPQPEKSTAPFRYTDATDAVAMGTKAVRRATRSVPASSDTPRD